MKCDTKYVLYNVYDIRREVEGSHMGLHKWCKHNEFHVFDNQKKKKIGHYVQPHHQTAYQIMHDNERCREYGEGGHGGTYTALRTEKRSKNGEFDMKKWNMADTGKARCPERALEKL